MFTTSIKQLQTAIKNFTPQLLKKQLFVTAIIAAVILSSCQKDLQTDKDAALFAGNANELKLPWQNIVRYGALIGGPDSVDEFSFQKKVAAKLGVSCLRESVLVPNGNHNED